MVLTVNVNNSNITLAVFEDDKMLMVAKTVTDKTKGEEDYNLIFRDLLQGKNINPNDIEGCILSCVVAQLITTIEDSLTSLLGKKPMLVAAGIKTGLKMIADNPSEIGSDIIVGAVGAISRYEAPIVIVSLNTATVYTVIDKNQALIGVSIAPGVRISAEALSMRASQLPYVPLEASGRVIGRNTAEAMKSGIMFGAAAQVDGMIDRIEAELGYSVNTIMTGPISKRLAGLCKTPIVIDEYLQLEGMNAIYHKNQRKEKN